MPLFGARTPAELRDKGIVTVLGMHRSGTSAIAGMLADHGIELGPVSEKNRFNPRGNREIESSTGSTTGSWSEAAAPGRTLPRASAPAASDYRRRNQILGSIPGETIGVKDPRLLLVLELWRDLDPRPIGVIRNPVAVRESLQRRAHERPRRHPQLSAGGMGRAVAALQPGAARRAPPPAVSRDRLRAPP